MTSTPNSHIPYVPQGTLDPAAGLNRALNVIDVLLQCAVISISETSPPDSPEDGDRYIVAGTGGEATGAWAGHENELARYVSEGNSWQFFAPGEQVFLIFNRENGSLYRFDESSEGGWTFLPYVSIPESEATYLTTSDEGSTLPNSRRLVAGTNVTFDDSNAGELRINAAGDGGGSSGGESATGAQVTRAANQTIANITDTEVTFSAEVRDEAGYWSDGSPTRFTISEDGWYALAGRINWSPSSTTGRRIIGFRVDGTTPICDAAQMPVSTIGTGTRMSVSTVAYLTSDQYVELVVRQDSGGNLDIESPGGGTPAAMMTIVKFP